MHSFTTTLITSLLLFSAVVSAIPSTHGSGRMHRLHKSSIKRRATGGKALRCGANRTTTLATVTPTFSEQTSSASTSTPQVAAPPVSTIATITTVLLSELASSSSSVPQVPNPTTTTTAVVLPTTLPQKDVPIVVSSPIDEVPSVPQATPSPPSAGLSADAIEALKWHNVVRQQHNAADLTWSDELAGAAQTWASNCVFQHSGGSLGPFGENLAAGTSNSYSIEDAVTAWTDEVEDYNPGNPVPSHYTQVVWKDTTQVGCAMVSGCRGIFSGSTARYYVCEYSPAGNVIGRFAQNVQ